MTRKLLIAIALLIALTPFLGISYSTQVVVTTALALFSAITLFFSRKPRMRTVPAVGVDTASPFGSQDSYLAHPLGAPISTTAPIEKHSQEMQVRHDGASHETPILHSSAASRAHVSSEEISMYVDLSTREGLPTHPIAPRPRRRKIVQVGDEQVSPEHMEVASASYEPAQLILPSNPTRVRRIPRAKSILADEEPIRPADAVIPAMELAREHAGVYGISNHN